MGLGGRLDFDSHLGCQLQRSKVFARHAVSRRFFVGAVPDHADLRIDHDANHTRPVLSAHGAERNC